MSIISTDSLISSLRVAIREREVIDLARSLVSRAVVDLLASEARKIDAVVNIERIVSPNFGEHLRISTFANREETDGTLLLVGHTDTVHPRGSLAQNALRTEGVRLYGPGIFDMKANCALALEALRACSITGALPKSEVVLLLTCDEETGSINGGRELVEREAQRARLALVLEPAAPGGRVKTGRKGTGMFTITVHGRAAHAGLDPEKGASAILEIARQIERLHNLSDARYGTTVNVGVVQGGTRSNVVAAEAYAEIDVRFTTNDEARRLESEIKNAPSFDPRVRVEVTGGVNRPPLERNEKVLALYEKARAIASQLKFDLGETQVGGASDANFIAALGVPVLDGLGLEGGGAHAVHEHIMVDNIIQRGALIAGLIALL